MHARIENCCANKNIWTQNQWCEKMSEAKLSDKYIVHQISQDEIFNLQEFADMFNWSAAKTSQIKEIRIVPNDLKIYVRYDWKENVSCLSIKKKNTTLRLIRTTQFKKLYKNRISLSEKKKLDIKKMMEKKYIPSEHHAAWNEILDI